MIYLASASPRRHELLCQAGIAHTVLNVTSPPGEDEPRLAGEPPGDYVLRTAHEKALRALHWLGLKIDVSTPSWPRPEQPLPLLPVLTADTTVILGNDILGKPRDEDDAAQMLRHLSGKSHEVQTAVVLAIPESDARPYAIYQDISCTKVRFKPLSEAEIAAYCRTGEPMGKAGAYGIQGRAATFVEYMHGSYTGVVGLPLFETGRLLEQAGIRT